MAYSDTVPVQSIAGDYRHLRRPLPIGYLLHNRYRITGVLSENGGFGMTYRAVDTYRNLNLDVVVKENFPLGVAVRNPITHELDPAHGMEQFYAKTLQRFEEEAELLSTFDHTNIVRVKAHFSELNTAYYVMPYIGGTELHLALPPPDELSEADLLPVLCCLLETLQYMHDHKLMHRDIKPNNILMDSEGSLKLIDFGLVRSMEATHTFTRNYTLGYAPVEQISGKGKSGPWTDIYSLGATCYALITGTPPPDSVARIEEDEYVPLQSREELCGRYSRELLVSIDRALQVFRRDRWQSAQEWLDSLAPAVPTPTTVGTPQQQTLSQQSARRLLQELRISPDEYNEKLRTAAREGNIEQLRLLIAAGADVNATDDEERTPLRMAAREGHTECVHLLLSAPGIDVNQVTNLEETPLYHAAYAGHADCIRLLLTVPGIDVNAAEYDDGYTPLYAAVKNDDAECVELLLTAPGIDVYKCCRMGTTPLDIAIHNKFTECVRLLLLSLGIDLGKGDNSSGITHTPKQEKTRGKFAGRLKNVITRINEKLFKWKKTTAAVLGSILFLTWVISGYTGGIGLAAEGGHSFLLRSYLILPGIDVNRKDEVGSTALYRAAGGGHSDCVELLLSTHDIDVNQANMQGWTPLHAAAWQGHIGCVRLLLAAPGIDVNKKTNDGFTPYNAAHYSNHNECSQLISSAGGQWK